MRADRRELVANALEFVRDFCLSDGDVEPTTQHEYDLARQLREQAYHQSETPDTAVKAQIDILADYIMAQIPGEPSRNEGAGDCAVRLLKQYRDAFRAITAAIGVPQPDCPASVEHAYGVACGALGYDTNSVLLCGTVLREWEEQS